MKIPKILQNSAIYSLVIVLQKCVSFFLLPLYTIFLTPADYGITGVVTSVSSLLAIFTTLGLDSAANRFYYKHKGDTQYISKLYGTIGLFIILCSLAFGGLFIVAHKLIIDPIVGEIPFYPYVLLGILNVIVTPLYLFFQSYLQTIQDGVKFGINAMINFLVQVGLTIVLVAVFKMGALGVLLASLITSVLFFIYVFFAFFRKQDIGIDKLILKEASKYSLPLLPHTLANWSNGTIDRLLVNGIRTEADAGLYNIGRQYSGVMNTISNAINSAYVPWFFDKVEDKEHGIHQIRRMSEVITYTVCFIGIVMALFSQEVLDVMISNPAYDGVWKVIPFLICSAIFNAIYFFYVNVLFLKDTGVIFTITVSTIAINVGLNLWLIPTMGYMGCGVACLLTYFIKSVLATIISMVKNKEIRFRTPLLYAIGLVASLICLSALLFEEVGLWLSLCIKLISVLIIAIVIFLVYKEDFVGIFKTLKSRHQ